MTCWLGKYKPTSGTYCNKKISQAKFAWEIFYSLSKNLAGGEVLLV